MSQDGAALEGLTGVRLAKIPAIVAPFADLLYGPPRDALADEGHVAEW